MSLLFQCYYRRKPEYVISLHATEMKLELDNCVFQKSNPVHTSQRFHALCHQHVLATDNDIIFLQVKSLDMVEHLVLVRRMPDNQLRHFKKKAKVWKICIK
jgi:hypothetical protein